MPVPAQQKAPVNRGFYIIKRFTPGRLSSPAGTGLSDYQANSEPHYEPGHEQKDKKQCARGQGYCPLP